MILVKILMELLKISLFLGGFFAVVIIGIHVVHIIFGLACQILVSILEAIGKIFTKEDE